MRCLFGLIWILIAVAVLILFDWLNARVVAMDVLGMLQYSVEVLAEWGDQLKSAMGFGQEAAEEVKSAVEKAKAAVEKISE